MKTRTMLPNDKKQEFRLKGWHVLVIFIGCFLIVFGANFYMAYKATTTMRGIDTSNAYERGLKYEKDVMASRAQSERDWKVDIDVQKGGNETRHVVIHAADKDGKVLTGLTPALTLAHPSDATKDVAIALREDGQGIFKGDFSAVSGKWYLHLTLEQNGEIKFRSRNSLKLQ